MAPQNRSYVFQAGTRSGERRDRKCKFASEITENVDVPKRARECRRTAQAQVPEFVQEFRDPADNGVLDKHSAGPKWNTVRNCSFRPEILR